MKEWMRETAQSLLGLSPSLVRLVKQVTLGGSVVNYPNRTMYLPNMSLGVKKSLENEERSLPNRRAPVTFPPRGTGQKDGESKLPRPFYRREG